MVVAISLDLLISTPHPPFSTKDVRFRYVSAMAPIGNQ